MKYRIMMCAGTVKQKYMGGLTYTEAVEICEDNGWVICPDGDGGFEWDLEVEEEG